MNMDNPPKFIHTKHNKVILDDISRNLHNTTRIIHRWLIHGQTSFVPLPSILNLKLIFFQSSWNICLSSEATLPANDQNDVINDIITIILTSAVFAFTKNAVDNKICGALCFHKSKPIYYDYNLNRHWCKSTKLRI